jgi:very-short-patch-repair endonuclease
MPRPRHTQLAAERARSLRRKMTISEARVWKVLKNGQCGARFRRQVPFGPWIVDFCAFQPRLVIEIDDPTHEWRDEFDRTMYIEGKGFPILRLTNKFVAQDLTAVHGTISYWVAELKQGRRPK